ncbi:unnamed protein product [Caenorhabditis angaria]|uniref:Uncharacterized protein n=1 Tax=Caenorhabditis angaria TaxID=860376 RepID=A0A9P1MY94_9PELO|nr:unnamed protein product [Caenorhabditis angaria]
MFRLFVTLLILAAAVDANTRLTRITADLGFKCKLPHLRVIDSVSFVGTTRYGTNKTLLRDTHDILFTGNPKRKTFKLLFIRNSLQSKIYVDVKHNCTPSGRLTTSRYSLVDLPIVEPHRTVRKTLILQK